MLPVNILIFFQNPAQGLILNTYKKKSAKTGAKPKYSAPALEKGLNILEYLSGRGAGENLTSIAQGIGKSNTEIFRMLSVLEDQGFVERLPDRDKFKLTDKLFNLSLNQPSKKILINLATAAMEKFASECLNSCHLSVRKGDEIVVVSRVDSPYSVCVTVPPGHHIPLIDSPSGHCMVAFSRPEQIETVVAEVKKAKGVNKSKKFRDTLSNIRKNGYFIMRDGFAKGVVGLSAPILDLEQEQCSAAMTSPVLHIHHLKDEDLYRIGERLKFYADAVTRQYNNRTDHTQ